MSLFENLLVRGNSRCELCTSDIDLSLYEILPAKKVSTESSLVLCSNCRSQIEDATLNDPHYWRCLTESIWSEHLPVKVMSYRILSKLKNQSWARELLDQMYLEDAELAWAQEGLDIEEEAFDAPTLDNNGARLMDGDSVTLIKDLEVKGGGFTAKRGTLVKNISLTANPKQVEGRVNGIQIVLVSAFLKKVV